LIKTIKEKNPKIKGLTHEVLASTLSYLLLAPPMSSLVVLNLLSHYRFILLPHYELVPPWASVG
jgi:hypothetical protein